MLVTAEQLENRYAAMTARVLVSCQAVTPLVGGVTAGETGIRAFITHHLKILDPVEAENAFVRIMKEEIGERDLTPATGELSERLTYGINVIRRTETGPYLGNWMIHANIKTAMSKLGMFVETKGTKGNVAECGIVRPYGISKKDARPDCIYLIGPDGEPAQTYFDEFKGRISTPKGSASIIHHSECVPAGTAFQYEFAFLRGMGDRRLTDADIIDWLALSMIVGVGSVKALGNGKVKITEAEILEAEAPRTPKPKKDKKKEEKPAEEEVSV